MKEITIKDIEKILKEIGIPEYPKYIGEGLWKLSENCITNEKGLAAFYKEIIKNTTVTQKERNKDLCETCKHYWTNFSLSLERVVSHCEILDVKSGLSANMNSEVPRPCLRCPFNCYIKR